MNDDILKALVDEVAEASGYGGLDMGTMYGKFAFDVAQRAVLEERERTALICEEFANDEWSHNETANRCAEAIRARSNAMYTAKPANYSGDTDK